MPSIFQITPSSGSVYGGQLLTIVGNGFDNTTIVTVGTKKCTITSTTINQLTCLTGAQSAGSSSFSIRF
jgi:hypothetical protein